MNIKAIVVAGVVLVAGGTVSLSAQSQEPFALYGKEFKLLGLDYWLARPLQGKVVKGAPYSAEITTESIQTLSDGNRIVHRSTEKVYRDADGRVRREETAGQKVTITITDPVAQRSFTLDPAARTARQSPLLPLFGTFSATGNLSGFGGDYAWAFRNVTGQLSGGRLTATVSADSRGPDSPSSTAGRRGRGARTGDSGNDYQEEHLASRSIEGVVASGIRRTTTIPQGAIGNEQPIKIVSEEWTSADLQVLVLTETSDPRTGRSTYKLSNINRSNPDPSLFKVPSDYTMAGRTRAK